MSEEDEPNSGPGQFVMKKLFSDFVQIAGAKLQHISSQDLDFPIMKCLQRGEDAPLDQLLVAMKEVSSYCLKSLVETLLKWRDQQIQNCKHRPSTTSLMSRSGGLKKGTTTSDVSEAKAHPREYYQERYELAVECLFCMVLVEILSELSVHPIPDTYVGQIEDLAFKHFKAQESILDRNHPSPNVQNMVKVAGIYAEVIGVLSQARFSSVKNKYFDELKDTQNSVSTMVSITEGMKFLRVKMFPVEELEGWFKFLQELAAKFMECQRDRLKHSMSQLLIEILLPVAAVISLEVTLPHCKKFVNSLYPYCLEQVKRQRNVLDYVPLVIAVLGVSEEQYFLSNWQTFLSNVIMPNLRSKDAKFQKVALEGLYRLLWIYVVRVKCADNVTTKKDLKSIVETLFPKQRSVFPKNMPNSTFVKIIQFISTERLDFAMKEIILELLSIPKRDRGNLHPERMNIGLRAFLFIADHLEKNEGSPPMPNTFGTLPGKAQVLKQKQKLLNTTLTEETVKKMGLHKYLPQVQRSLGQLLKLLDVSVGRPLLATQVAGKTEEELCGGDKKPKLELLKTCVASIPRIMPEGMSLEELIDLLSRLTAHVDVELKKQAYTSMLNLLTYYSELRKDIVKGYVMFIVREVPDTYPQELEACLRILTLFLTHWKTTIGNEADKETKKLDGKCFVPLTKPAPSEASIQVSNALRWSEAVALMTMCSYRPVTRKVSLSILKEVRSLREVTEQGASEEESVMNVIDKIAPIIISRYIETLMPSEKRDARKKIAKLNINWLCEKRNSLLELSGDRTNISDAWALCLAGLMAPDQLPHHCPTATRWAWPWIMQRLMKVFQSVDPYFSSTDTHKSSMRGKKTIPLPSVVSLDMFLWRNYLIFACCGAFNVQQSKLSTQNSMDTSASLDEKSVGKHGKHPTARDLLHNVVPLLYYDGEIMEAALTALGMVNPIVFSDLVEELQPMIREAFDSRKSDARNVKKSLRKFRESLRVKLTRVFELTAFHGCFSSNTSARLENGRLAVEFEEFIDGMRTYLNSESDNDSLTLNDLRLHLSGFISKLILSLPRGEARVRLLTPEMRYDLFFLLGNWCGHFGILKRHYEVSRRPSSAQNRHNPDDLSCTALEAMSALVCSGPVFDHRGLIHDGYIYRWTNSMMHSTTPRVPVLGRRTIQQLLQNNMNTPLLLNWVVDNCFRQERPIGQLYFHALSNTLASITNYPCDVVTILHAILFNTGDPDHHIRERAIQLLQVMHNRFFGKSSSDLVSALTWTYSNGHLTLSNELAKSNPELTLPFISEMVYRIEMVSRFGQRNILQYMVPWIQNVELVEGAYLKNPQPQVMLTNLPPEIMTSTKGSLNGTGWGSVEGTRLVLYNLLNITAKYGDDHVKEVEELWGALCRWRKNIHITINFLIHIARVSSSSALLQHVKKIIVCFVRTQQIEIIEEVIDQLKSLDPIPVEADVVKQVPRYHLQVTEQATSSKSRRTVIKLQEDQEHQQGYSDSRYASSNSLKSVEGGGMVPAWVAHWRTSWKQLGGMPMALPLPSGRSYLSASILELLNCEPYRYQIHRCNFAVMFLSELVVNLYNFNWMQYLPRLLHMLTLGLDVSRPVVFEHSKKLLINLVVVLACREDKAAASRARMYQRELSLRSPSASSLLIEDIPGARESIMVSCESLESIIDENSDESQLTNEARDLIEFVSKCPDHLPHEWPFTDVSSRSYSTGSVGHLEELVERIIQVFTSTKSSILLSDWSQEALHWATRGHNPYSCRSLQVCRALHLSLSSGMLSSMVTRMTEHVADNNEEVQTYVMEMMLTLEMAIGYTSDMYKEQVLDGGNDFASKPIGWPELSSTKYRSSLVREEKADEEETESQSSSPVKSRCMDRSSLTSPERFLSSPDKRMLSRPTAEMMEAYRKSLNAELKIQENVQPEPKKTESVRDAETTAHSSDKEGDSQVTKTSTVKEERKPTMEVEPSLKEPLLSKDVPQTEQVPVGAIPQQTSSSDTDSRLTPPLLQHRKHARNQSMTKPINQEESSAGEEAKDKSSSAGEEVKEKETKIQQPPTAEPSTQALPSTAAPNSKMVSPLNQTTAAILSSKVQSTTTSQTSSPTESPSRSPVRAKRLLKSAIFSTSKLSESMDGGTSMSLAIHPSIRRKGSEPSKQRINELKSGKVKRWGSEDQVDASGRGSGRPTSLVEPAGHKRRPASWVESMQRIKGYSFGEKMIEASDLFAELFMTSVSLLESDYENEFVMSLRLMDKVLDRFDLRKAENEEKLDSLFNKINWPNFKGVQSLLLKGLTTTSGTYKQALNLLSRITPFSTKAIFDPTRHAGLPLNITSLLPMLMLHFQNPNDFCITCAKTIAKVCVELPSNDIRSKLSNMAAMFDLYHKRDGRYNKSPEMWASGLCRYLNDAYPSLAADILKLLVEMLERGPSDYHRPVMRLIQSYWKLQDSLDTEMINISRHILAVVCHHIKSPLWREAVDILKLSVCNSASIIAPATSSKNTPMHNTDIGTQTLPGPTLAFSMTLAKGSADMELTKDTTTSSTWKRPQVSQRRTRERFNHLLSAFGPGPELPSPSIDLEDLYSDDEYFPDSSPTASLEERMSALIEVSQQREEEELMDFIDDQYNFLDDLDEIEESSSNEEEKYQQTSRRSVSLESLEDKDKRDLHTTISVPALTTDELPESKDGAKVPEVLDEVEEISPPPVDAGSAKEEEEAKESDQDMPAETEEPLPPVATPTIVGTEFSNISSDDVEELWRDHVTVLLRDKNVKLAVNTVFIVNKLFMVLRQRFVNLTREACNYLSDHYQNITQPLLGGLEILCNKFEHPLIYIDVELMSSSRILDQHLFHVMEITNNLTSYLEKRKNVLECLSQYKDQLRQQSCEPKEGRDRLEPCHHHTSSSTSSQKMETGTDALKLCWAVYRFHFQYLVTLGSYVKLLEVFYSATSAETGTDLSTELSEVHQGLRTAVTKWQKDPPSKDLELAKDQVPIQQSVAINQLLDLIEKKQFFEVVNELHVYRRIWRGSVFGSTNDHDLPALFYLYARYLAEKQEGPGIVCVTAVSSNLSGVHGNLTRENITLHELVKEEEEKLQEELESLSVPEERSREGSEETDGGKDQRDTSRSRESSISKRATSGKSQSVPIEILASSEPVLGGSEEVIRRKEHSPFIGSQPNLQLLEGDSPEQPIKSGSNTKATNSELEDSQEELLVLESGIPDDENDNEDDISRELDEAVDFECDRGDDGNGGVEGNEGDEDDRGGEGNECSDGDGGGGGDGDGIELDEVSQRRDDEKVTLIDQMLVQEQSGEVKDNGEAKDKVTKDKEFVTKEAYTLEEGDKTNEEVSEQAEAVAHLDNDSKSASSTDESLSVIAIDDVDTHEGSMEFLDDRDSDSSFPDDLIPNQL